MKKVAAFIATFMVAIALTFASAAPSMADTTKTTCAANDGEVCLKINYHKDADGVGITVNWINLSCAVNYPIAGWDHPAVDGYYIHIWKDPNATNELKWSRGDPLSDVDIVGGFCNRTIAVNETYENANSIRIDWLYTEKLNLATDKQGYEFITVSH